MSGFLRVSDVADQFDMTPRTVLTWIEKGYLPACRLPSGRLRIPQTAVDALIEYGMTTQRVRKVVSLNADRIGD